MAHEVVMPQLGLSMDSGRIMRWLKGTGEHVEAGEVLLEVESNKATVEVEAAAAGTVHVVRGPDDGDIQVGEVIGYLLGEGEAAPQTESPEGAAAGPSLAPEKQPEGKKGDGPGTDARRARRPDRPPSSPAARRRAGELGVDWREAKGTGPGDRIKVRDVERLAAAQPGETEFGAPTGDRREKVRMSPLARRLAESVGLDIERIAGEHPGERLELSHVEEALREAVQIAQSSQSVSSPAVAPSRDIPGRRRPLSQVRRVIAQRMSESAQTTAAVTLTSEVDASQLVSIREQFKADPSVEGVPSYNVLLAKAVAEALMDYPQLNASLDGDELIEWNTVNIGIAVDAESGLVVPVVRDVQEKPLGQLTEEMGELLGRAREGRVMPDELSGGTFTITNLGSFGVDAFTPIINPPECAVLGVGRLHDDLVIFEGQPVIKTMVALSLTFDHRIIDGAPAARFLQRLGQLLERPLPWLMAEDGSAG